MINTCERIQRSLIAEFNVFDQLPEYICHIAACYNPENKHPEQCITIGSCLHIVQEMAYRIDQLFKQRGLDRFRHLRIRHIQDIYQKFNKLQKNPLMALYLRYRRIIQRLSLIRLIILPDPFSWLFYLSNQFTIITLTRYLLFEIYLYTGRLAVQAYGQSETSNRVSFSQEELEELMYDLERLQAIESTVQSEIPCLKKIRKKNLGFGRGLMANLSLKQWKLAVIESAQIIASQHFPDSDTPLLEATVGPILERSRYWLKTVNTIQSIPVVHKMAAVKLETVIQAKLLIDNIPERLKQTIAASMKVYQWAKWPITIYQLARKTTPIGMATSIGWIVTRNCIIFYLYHYTFYTACNELNAIYMLSLNEKIEKNERDDSLELSGLKCL
ncbi:MAG: hypothetical protein OMM_05372 [Candidatus Magnetoglobus multicellularis str. Araruama]|uniref:Uncharacterized protein n=1 Tax=Candidatus Magnetoglobus multicellularis str. Araruama TaxID=890399 RepID=A0A1V1NWS3_9BACT|nr:MAG: hypothetical protein OMM_05372 [Candidatus Magnetoglobus multicellularis str. Araruama]